MKRLFTIGLLFTAQYLNAQLNVNQLGHLDLCTLHDQMLNDVWGYEDELGNSYVLAGGTKGTSVVSIVDPSNPIEVFFEPGMESIWRDLKSFNDYAYITTEAQNGLLIIDLSPLPASSSLAVTYYTGPSGQEWQSAHNLYIDELGYAYIFGANRGNGGVIILDVFTDPMNPIEVGVFDNWYVHDGYVVNDTLFCGHIMEGFMSMVDVSDRANPVLLGTVNTPSFFTHNVWKGAGNYAFTTDEVSGGYIGSYDISDPANMVELDRIQSSPGSGVIPHNVHVQGDHVITSYYSDGVVIHDATYPYNLIEVGNFDTYPTQTSSYDGCWGAYPFFTNGIIAATDRSEGLFILSPNYVQGAYLEGTVIESGTLVPLDQVKVEISTTNQTEFTNAAGIYAGGCATGGLKQVICSKVGYYPDTAMVSLTNGVITYHDVVLTPIPQYNLTISVYDATTLFPLSDVFVELEQSLITHQGMTNGLGQESFSLYYEDDYKIRIGKWSYMTYCNVTAINSSTGNLSIYLDKNYYDDFSFDYGWSTTSTATSGAFVRAEPNGTDGGAQTDFDVSDDCDNNCYVTGNSTQAHPDVDDVDNGVVSLLSPIMDLSSYSDPYLNYSRWFYCFYGALPYADVLNVYVDNGLSGPVLVEQVVSNELDFYQWHDVSFRILDFVSLTSSMQVMFVTADLDPDANITEAAIDHFYVIEAAELGLTESIAGVKLYPNPTKDHIMIEGLTGEIKVMDSFGRLIIELQSEKAILLDTKGWESGVYFLQHENSHHKFIVEK